MDKINFLDRTMAGKSPQVKAAALRILDLYLSAPAWSRDATSAERKAQLRRIIEEAVSAAGKGGSR